MAIYSKVRLIDFSNDLEFEKSEILRLNVDQETRQLLHKKARELDVSDAEMARNCIIVYFSKLYMLGYMIENAVMA
jgi:hypothetical protein